MVRPSHQATLCPPTSSSSKSQLLLVPLFPPPVQWTNYSSSLRTQLRQSLVFLRGRPSPLASGKTHRSRGVSTLSYVPSRSHRLVILYGQSLLLLLSVTCTPVALALPGSLQECRITHGIRVCLETRPSPTRVVHTQLQV